MQTVASRRELEGLLADDVPHGDLTTDGLGLQTAAGTMQFLARDPMVLALAEDAAEIIELAGGSVALHAATGEVLDRGAPILTAHGPAPALLRGWKVAQTLIEIWSGVASEAHAMVTAARASSPDVVVACTRKNVPGTKRFAVAAVKAGGAVMHRLGLSESILLFPEHLSFCQDQSLEDLARRLRRAAPEKRLVVEVASIDAALAAAGAGFDVLQTEKFSPAEVGELAGHLSRHRARPLIAAAGGIHAGNVGAYVEAGADIIVTSSPYMAKPKDVQVRIGRSG